MVFIITKTGAALKSVKKYSLIAESIKADLEIEPEIEILQTLIPA